MSTTTFSANGHGPDPSKPHSSSSVPTGHRTASTNGSAPMKPWESPDRMTYVKYEIQSILLERAGRLRREADLLHAQSQELANVANGPIEKMFDSGEW